MIGTQISHTNRRLCFFRLWLCGPSFHLAKKNKALFSVPRVLSDQVTGFCVLPKLKVLQEMRRNPSEGTKVSISGESQLAQYKYLTWNVDMVC